jgi:group I intron endonuclease
MGYIYLITNRINGKKYVGQTIQNDINKRWTSHKNLKNKTVGQILYNAYKKYGVNNFDYKIICICFDDDTNKYEEQYINKYNTIYPNGYNLLPGGDNRKHNEYTKKQISENLTGLKNPNFGVKKTPEQIKQMSERMKGINNPQFGKKFTKEELQKKLDMFKNKPEIKTKISNSLKEYYKNNLGVSKNKKVEQYDLNGNLLNVFYSISEAARHVNISVQFLSRTCNKDNYTAAGFKWKKY